MNHFDEQTLPVGLWRNGGGETREIARRSAGPDDFAWRAGIATIARDGPFSAFPGIDRSITLVAGDGVHLLAPGLLDHRLAEPGEPFAFSGDVALRATLPGGAVRVLNIMTRRGRWAAHVRRITSSVTPAPGHDGVLYVLRGRWHHDRPVHPGQGTWWTDETPGAPTPSTQDALALWANIHPL